MDQRDFDDLRYRMIHHKVIDGKAVVTVSAAELGKLLDYSEKWIRLRQSFGSFLKGIIS